MTYKELKKTDEINTYIEQGNLVLSVLGIPGSTPPR